VTEKGPLFDKTNLGGGGNALPVNLRVKGGRKGTTRLWSQSWEKGSKILDRRETD